MYKIITKKKQEFIEEYIKAVTEFNLHVATESVSFIKSNIFL